jgi:hypothetical protein
MHLHERCTTGARRTLARATNRQQHGCHDHLEDDDCKAEDRVDGASASVVQHDAEPRNEHKDLRAQLAQYTVAA